MSISRKCLEKKVDRLQAPEREREAEEVKKSKEAGRSFLRKKKTKHERLKKTKRYRVIFFPTIFFTSVQSSMGPCSSWG